MTDPIEQSKRDHRAAHGLSEELDLDRALSKAREKVRKLTRLDVKPGWDEEPVAVVFEAGQIGGRETSLFVTSVATWNEIRAVYEAAQGLESFAGCGLGVFLRMPFIEEVARVSKPRRPFSTA